MSGTTSGTTSWASCQQWTAIYFGVQKKARVLQHLAAAAAAAEAAADQTVLFKSANLFPAESKQLQQDTAEIVVLEKTGNS